MDTNKSKLRMTIDIAQAIYETDGFRGFYRGYFASLCAYVPNSALWWAFYHIYQGEFINFFFCSKPSFKYFQIM